METLKEQIIEIYEYKKHGKGQLTEDTLPYATLVYESIIKAGKMEVQGELNLEGGFRNQKEGVLFCIYDHCIKISCREEANWGCFYNLGDLKDFFINNNFTSIQQITASSVSQFIQDQEKRNIDGYRGQ